MMTRCCVVCPIASGGGITESFLTCLEMLREYGIKAAPVVPSDFVFKDRLRDQDFAFQEIRNLERGGAFNLALQAWGIAAAVRKNNADIVLLNNGRHVKLIKWLLPDKPIVVIYHGGKLSRYLSADRIITINDDQLGYLLDAGYPSDQCVVVDNALPVRELPPYQAKPRSSPPVVGTLRLLEHAKGVDILVQAIGVLAKRGTRLETRIGSGGSQKDHLIKLAQEWDITDLVHFDGWIEDKEEFLNKLDIYVLPSRAEEWGIGIVEANAARLSVVATKTLGPKRIVVDGITGILVPISDPESMADAIQKLVNDQKLAEQLAKAGYEHCKQNFLFPKVAPIMAREVLRVLEKA